MSGGDGELALDPYDVLAPVYDRFTGGHDHAAWAGILEAIAQAAGLCGARALDLGCGTGSSTRPLLERGYQVTGVDRSPAMLARAREKLGPAVRLECADMRALPALGRFDLVWCVADGVNCLLDDAELVAAFAGVRANLAPEGVFVFDVDTIASFRALYSGLLVVPAADGVAIFDGQAPPELQPDAVAVAVVEHLRPAEQPPWWTRSRAVHRQRHHSRTTLERTLQAAGLTCAAVWGTDIDGRREPALDEARHNKAVYVARVGA